MTRPVDLAAAMAATARRIEAALDARLAGGPVAGVPPRLLAAMRHAVLGGGKRLRPFLVLESARLFGAEALGLAPALAVECLHGYSLVHDDLPAMDDDAVRRGRPTVHKAFDEATAILAGDALQALAFELISTPEAHPEPGVRAELVLALARAAGAAGMCGGQQLDLEAENAAGGPLRTLDGVSRIQRLKTGAIIRFAAEAGAIVGQAGPGERSALVDFGEAFGLAYQVADDLLDVEGDAAVVGKATAKDAAAGKSTFVSLLGIEGARERLAAATQGAAGALAPFGAAAAMLRALAEFNARRRS